MNGSTPPPVLAVVHVFHLDVWERMAPGLAGTPLLITCPEGHGIPEAIRATRPDAQFFECPNRGRDWLPFLEALRAHPVSPDTVLIKLHTKMSPQVKDAERWRRGLVSPLASSTAQIDHIRKRFAADPTLGVLAPNGHLLRLQKYIAQNRPWLETLSGEADLDNWLFPAGSMFAARRSALDSIFALDLPATRFAPEPLAIDGHIPHAIERMIGWSAQRSGLHLDVVDIVNPADATAEPTSEPHIDPRYEDWDGELLHRKQDSATFNLFLCPPGTSALDLIRSIQAAKREVPLHHIFLPARLFWLKKLLQTIFQHSTFHVSEEAGLREAKQFLKGQTVSLPLAILSPASNRWITKIHRLGLYLTEPVGYEVWFGQAAVQTPDSEWASIRRYITDSLDMRWELDQVTVPNSGDIGLSVRMTRVWRESPEMPTEEEERRLLGVVTKLRNPGEARDLGELGNEGN